MEAAVAVTTLPRSTSLLTAALMLCGVDQVKVAMLTRWAVVPVQCLVTVSKLRIIINWPGNGYLNDIVI